MAKIDITKTTRYQYKDWKIEDIIAECEKNEGWLEWLDEVSAAPVAHYRYQKSTVIDDNGKKKKVVNKALPKKMVIEKPTFMEIRERFLVEKMGVSPAKSSTEPQKPKMAEKIAAAKALAAAKAKNN